MDVVFRVPARSFTAIMAPSWEKGLAAMPNEDEAQLPPATPPLGRLPPLPISSGTIRTIAAKGRRHPVSLSLHEICQLCEAVLAAVDDGTSRRL